MGIFLSASVYESVQQCSVYEDLIIMNKVMI